MNDIYEDSYFGEKIDDLTWEYHGINEFNVIADLSRQLRSFLKYKEQVVKFRFRSSSKPPVKWDEIQFMKDKNKLYDVASEFIHILKEIKKEANSITQGIKYCKMNPNCTSLRHLIEVMKKLYILIHKYSEQELCDYPYLLKLVVSLAREVCSVKKCLDLDIKEFLLELELGYEGLEAEMEGMLSKQTIQEKLNSDKVLEERLRS